MNNDNDDHGEENKEYDDEDNNINLYNNGSNNINNDELDQKLDKYILFFKLLQEDLAKFINRNKFINVTLLVLLCLAIQVSLYLLIPNNEFILSNMVTE